MAGADVIEAAIGITLLLIVSYVVLGSITTAANTVSSAKKDMTLMQEERLNTKIVVAYSKLTTNKDGQYNIEFGIKNTGNTIIDYTQMNMVIITQGTPPTIYINSIGDGIIGSSPVGTWWTDGIWGGGPPWPPEVVNPKQWDPGEFLYVWIKEIDPLPVGYYIFTPDGAKAEVTIL